MPKVKTLRAANKRFKKTATGKYKYKHAYRQHILTKKTTKHKRYLRHNAVFSRNYRTKIMQYLPYI